MYIKSQFNIVFDDWFATVAASLESLPDLNSPQWSKMFGESTFQYSFDSDDDSDGNEQFFDSSQDLPAALDRSHKAVSSAMDKHRLAIPIPIVPDAEEPIPSRIADPSTYQPTHGPSKGATWCQITVQTTSQTYCLPSKEVSVTFSKGVFAHFFKGVHFAGRLEGAY